MKVRLLHVLWEGVGGMERIVLDLTRNLDLTKYEITVAVLGRGGCHTDLIDRDKIRVVEFNARSGRDLIFIRAFYSFLRSNQFNIIHCHVHTFVANFLLILWRSRCVLIYHEHGGILLSSKNKTRLTYTFFSRFYHAYIALHEGMVQAMVLASRGCVGKTVIIENAVDTDYFKPSIVAKSGRKMCGDLMTVGTIGRLTPEKDLRLFLEVAKLIIQKRINVRFVIVGDGGMRSELQADANKAVFKGKVEFTGERSDIPDILRTFDLYLATSRIEAYGLAIIESLSCGVPVVAAQLESGAARIIYETYPGILLVRQRDAHMIAEACLGLLDNPQTTITMGQTGRAYVMHHNNLRNYIQSVDALYQRLLAGNANKKSTESSREYRR